MKLIAQLDSTNVLRKISKKELGIGTQILLKNLKFKPTDKILILADEKMRDREAAIWFESAKHLTKNVEMIVLGGMTHSGEEPPAEVVAAVANADISLFQTSFSLTHTRAGKAVMAHNHRGFSLPSVNYELLIRTCGRDYSSIKELGEKLKNRLKKAKVIKIISANGTNIIGTVRQDGIYNDGGILTHGEIGNLPAGEVFFAPLLGSVNGTVVIDGSMADDVLDEPIHITIENGVAVRFGGGKAAKNLEEKLRAHEGGCVVAEIGIGTNPDTNPRGELTEAEKAYGTVHIAFGNSSAIGGENNVPIHLDGVILFPEVALDGKVILKNRKFQLDTPM